MKSIERSEASFGLLLVRGWVSPSDGSGRLQDCLVAACLGCAVDVYVIRVN